MRDVDWVFPPMSEQGSIFWSGKILEGKPFDCAAPPRAPGKEMPLGSSIRAICPGVELRFGETAGVNDNLAFHNTGRRIWKLASSRMTP